jgi:uroporphyrinogen decarboxylase
MKAAQFDHPAVCNNLVALRQLAGDDVPVLGFAGAPLTMASYAIEGRMTRYQHLVKAVMFQHPAEFEHLLGAISETVADYLVKQVQQGGASAVQLFESQAGMLSRHQYLRYALPWQQQVISTFKQACPGVPVTLYARGSAPFVEFMADSGADVVSIDWTHTLADVHRRIPGKTLQGNLDPAVLLDDNAVAPAVAEMVEGFDWRRGFIGNLGHGIIPQAKVSAARTFVDCIHNLAAGAV